MSYIKIFVLLQSFISGSIKNTVNSFYMWICYCEFAYLQRAEFLPTSSYLWLCFRHLLILWAGSGVKEVCGRRRRDSGLHFNAATITINFRCYGEPLFSCCFQLIYCGSTKGPWCKHSPVEKPPQQQLPGLAALSLAVPSEAVHHGSLLPPAWLVSPLLFLSHNHLRFMSKWWFVITTVMSVQTSWTMTAGTFLSARVLFPDPLQIKKNPIKDSFICKIALKII